MIPCTSLLLPFFEPFSFRPAIELLLDCMQLKRNPNMSMCDVLVTHGGDGEGISCVVRLELVSHVKAGQCARLPRPFRPHPHPLAPTAIMS